jgi:hypothetical protein
MTVRNFGREQVATFALAAAMLSAAIPARAQDTGTSSRPIDFRLPPPADDGRTPGVQGPSDNGLPPVAPGERRGQPTPTPAPTPTQPVAPPRVAPTQPATVTPAPTPTRQGAPAVAAPRTAAPETASPALPATTDNPVLPLETAAPSTAAPTDAAPVTADETPVAGAPANAPSGTPVWAWVLAALAAAGAGFWYWRRRAAPVGPVIDEAPEAPRPARTLPAQRAASPASPKPATPTQRVAPRPAAPQPARAPLVPPERPAHSPLVTRPAAEKRAIIGMALDIRSIRFAADHVAVGFALHLVNQGPTAATGLMVRIALNQGSAMAEPVLARFFDGAGGSVLRDDMTLAPGAGEELSTEVMLPRASIEPLMIGGKPMLVPVIAFDVTYHWDGEGDAFGQNAGSFVIGREQGASGSEKLAPLPLDRAVYAVDRPGARATAIKRNQ